MCDSSISPNVRCQETVAAAISPLGLRPVAHLKLLFSAMKLIATRVENDLLLDLRSLRNLIRLYRHILAEAQRRALLRAQSIIVLAVVVNHDDSGA
jgi:hypothetical protein